MGFLHFLLDSALSQPKSPNSTLHRTSDLTAGSSGGGGGVEDEIKTLKAEIKSIKDDFSAQMKELRDTVKHQAEKIASLEKELEKSSKKDDK